MIRNFDDLRRFIGEFELEDVTISSWFDNGMTVRINGQVVKLPKSEAYVRNIIRQTRRERVKE